MSEILERYVELRFNSTNVEQLLRTTFTPPLSTSCNRIQSAFVIRLLAKR